MNAFAKNYYVQLSLPPWWIQLSSACDIPKSGLLVICVLKIYLIAWSGQTKAENINPLGQGAAWGFGRESFRWECRSRTQQFLVKFLGINLRSQFDYGTSIRASNKIRELYWLMKLLNSSYTITNELFALYLIICATNMRQYSENLRNLPRDNFEPSRKDTF